MFFTKCQSIITQMFIRVYIVQNMNQAKGMNTKTQTLHTLYTSSVYQ